MSAFEVSMDSHDSSKFRPAANRSGRHKGVRVCLRYGLACVMLSLLCACADNTKANERVTGDCHALMTHCSSRQSTVDLSDTERIALKSLQERMFAGLSASETVTASASALKTLGYTVTSTDSQAGVVHAELNKVVATKGQRRGRALVKLVSAATGVPIRGSHLQGPDHESIHALALTRPGPGTQATVVRIEFETTVVDSKGNSETSTPTDSKPYSEFFNAFAAATHRTTEEKVL
jgi:hypothetical protein